MMRFIILALLGFFCIILESTIFSQFLIAGVKPDFILIIVIFFALFNGSKKGAFAGLALGFLEDIFLNRFIGLNAVCKFLVGLFIGSFEKRIYKDNYFVPVMGLFLGSILYCMFLFLFSSMIGYPMTFIQIQEKTIPFAVYNTCFVPFIYGKFYKSSTNGILKA